MSIDMILERAVNGERITMDDAIKLYESDEIEKNRRSCQSNYEKVASGSGDDLCDWTQRKLY